MISPQRRETYNSDTDKTPMAVDPTAPLEDSARTSLREVEALARLTAHVNEGILLEDVLERIYQDFRGLIPYDRIGLAMIEDGSGVAKARWVRSEAPCVHLGAGFAAPVAGSGLEAIVASRRPRIINDLAAYLAGNPSSRSTALMLAEGMRSSLTCPLTVRGDVRGFLFFSSVKVGTYGHVHADLFEHVAGQISVIIEKARLTVDLEAKEREIEQRNEELRRLSEYKSALLGIVAHDLRNPLHAIRMTSELMLDPAIELSERERRDSLDAIQRQSRYMLEMLEGLLDLALIEAGKLVLAVDEIDLGALLPLALGRFRRLAERKGIRLELGDAPTALVRADRLRINQVLDNLLSNALKFSPPESTIRVRALEVEDSWCVEVSDEGPGVSGADRVRLFEEYAPLGPRPTGDERSTGLGLAIARRVLEAHGGRIGADFGPPGARGSTFWFTLPRLEDA